MRSARALAGLCAAAFLPTVVAADLRVTTNASPAAGGVSLVDADVIVDDGAAAVVHEAGALLAADLSRVSGRRSTTRPAADARRKVLVGTIGDGGTVDQLVAAGKVDPSGVAGRWETFAWQVIDSGRGPTLVIVGSDRRGTAYGCTELSRAIGVSPWNWWADVPLEHHAQLAVTPGRRVDGPPGVKYRGIFLNDEDWGLRPWAGQTFDPTLGNLGPKTYAKLFELMLRLRLNYLWPAMHPGSAEFGKVPGNPEVADRWAVVMGASHCEPMLRNNVYWNRADGDWRYDTNRAHILPYWADAAEHRGAFEAVWTLGIRGIHDSQMQGPKAVPDRVNMVEGIFADQRQLIDAKVTTRFGPPAECFVPYKEVLPLYNAGLKVPADVTLVWPDDNFGYIRHLPTAAERARPGGSGIYYHVSYWGGPQSYLWVESTSPGLTWEELHKAWQNDARRLWVVNVGDLKPAEVAVDFYSRLAWSPDAWGPDAQAVFLHRFCDDTFGPDAGRSVAELQAAYYRLAAVRRPDQFQWQWINSLSAADQAELLRRYVGLADQEAAAAKTVPADRADAYFEMVGYAARVLAATGQLYLHDTAAQRPGHAADLVAARTQWSVIQRETRRYNEETAGGKWRHMMWLTPQDLAWPTDVGGTHRPRPLPAEPVADQPHVTVDAADGTMTANGGPAWRSVAGLGYSGRAITVVPATAFADGQGPTVTFGFDLPANLDGQPVHLRLDLLPTMRVAPGGHLRVRVQVDAALADFTSDVPGGESGDENSGPRRASVLTNRVTIDQPVTLNAGHHTLAVTAVDPGVVLDQVELPAGSVVTAAGGSTRR